MGEQKRIFFMIPGFEQVGFVRFGMIHRNTYINGTAAPMPMSQSRHRPPLFFPAFVRHPSSGARRRSAGHQEMLGHARISTTQRYTCVSAAQLMSVYKKRPTRAQSRSLPIGGRRKLPTDDSR